MFFAKHVEISFYECFVLFEILRKKSYVFQAHSFGAGKCSMSNKISTSKQYLGSTQTVNLKNQENQVW